MLKEWQTYNSSNRPRWVLWDRTRWFSHNKFNLGRVSIKQDSSNRSSRLSNSSPVSRLNNLRSTARKQVHRHRAASRHQLKRQRPRHRHKRPSKLARMLSSSTNPSHKALNNSSSSISSRRTSNNLSRLVDPVRNR